MERGMICPEDNGQMETKEIAQNVTFKGEQIEYVAELYVCQKCGFEVGTVEQTAKIQKTIADEYRKKVALLTGQEIKEKREGLRWTQGELADRAGVGIASIKRWENAGIQNRAMDSVIRSAFEGAKNANIYTGNRSFSIPRVALVIHEFQSKLNIKLLNEKGLFTAKYLWYADMLSFLKNGISLTGSTYAKLPYGPQLNNYVELLDEIRQANIDEAEPLTKDEKKVIAQVALLFPNKRQIFDASHREPVWKEKSTGDLIPYTDAERLIEVHL